MGHSRTRNLAFGACLLLALLPLVLSTYYLSIVSEILIFSILALSLNILVGYTGLVSLGHAAFFGVGAYTASLLSIHVSSNLFVTLFLSVLLSVVAAGVIGFLCNRVSGFYFLMLTLAFSQMIYALVYNWGSLTGGDNGLSGVPRPTLGDGFAFEDAGELYLLILVVFGIVLIFLQSLLRSPFGHIFVGIRENEQRMRAIGYNTTLYKNLAFLIAGGIGGAAGCLYSYFMGFVSPKDLYWTVSGEALIMVLIGGAGTLLGPILGAAFIVLLESMVSSYTDLWMLIIGITFVLFVIFVPKGLAGLGTQWKKDGVRKKWRTVATNESKNGIETINR
jgi:branched-chain amino acid transport system permease protein